MGKMSMLGVVVAFAHIAGGCAGATLDQNRDVILLQSPRSVVPTFDAASSTYTFDDQSMIVEIRTSTIENQGYIDGIVVNGVEVEIASPNTVYFFAIDIPTISLVGRDYGSEFCAALTAQTSNSEEIFIEFCEYRIRRILQSNADGEVLMSIETPSL